RLQAPISADREVQQADDQGEPAGAVSRRKEEARGSDEGKGGSRLRRRPLTRRKETFMIKRVGLLVLVPALLVTGIAVAQFPILDMMADRVDQKYQSSTCEQLWEARGKPKSEREQELIQMLRGDPQARAAFINKIAAPVANKMFECGLIP